MSYERGLSRKNFSLEPAAILFSLQPAPLLIDGATLVYTRSAAQLLSTDSSQVTKNPVLSWQGNFALETLFAHAELQQANDPRLQAALTVGH